MNAKKAPGFDLITARLLKELPKECVVFLTNLCNATLRLSQFPNQHSRNILIPVHQSYTRPTKAVGENISESSSTHTTAMPVTFMWNESSSATPPATVECCMSQNEHIIRLLGEVSTPETSDDDDPYGDDGGEFDSDEDYRPSSTSESSKEEIGMGGISTRHRRSSSSSNESNAVVSPSLQSDGIVINPVIQSPVAEQYFCQKNSNAVQTENLDVSFQSLEEEQPNILGDNSCFPSNDNMDLSRELQEVEQSVSQGVCDTVLQQLNDDDEWSTSTLPIIDFNFDRSSTGPKFDLKQIETRLDMFKLVFTENLIDQIIHCTNNYGIKLTNQDRPHTRNSRNCKFRPVDQQEILSFLGMCLLQGQLKFPVRRSFFSNDPLYYHPVFQYITSGRRFEQILRCLCVADDKAKGEDKVLDFIRSLNHNFQSIYGPSKELSID
ncbi:unnamed protein product [Euphydryas editha]|uniref:PiggyBac transposable element-derived protein domain-containing protein n=1 Tax=Euphydryas editha TaxID=104508 RepID=A0AAU9TIF8_EUPED|nr:unnamed protein product [Euphydryas editha]